MDGLFQHGNFPRIFEALPKAKESTGNENILTVAHVNNKHIYATNSEVLVRHDTVELFGEEFANIIPHNGIVLNKMILDTLIKKDIDDVDLNHSNGTVMMRVTFSTGLNIEFDVTNNFKASPPDFESVIPLQHNCRPLEVFKVKSSLITRAIKAMGNPERIYFRAESERIVRIDPDPEAVPGQVVAVIATNYS